MPCFQYEEDDRSTPLSSGVTACMTECLDSSYTILYTVTTFGSAKILVVAFWTVFMARLCTASAHHAIMYIWLYWLYTGSASRIFETIFKISLKFS